MTTSMATYSIIKKALKLAQLAYVECFEIGLGSYSKRTARRTAVRKSTLIVNQIATLKCRPKYEFDNFNIIVVPFPC